MKTEIYAKPSFQKICGDLKEVLSQAKKSVTWLDPTNAKVQKVLKPVLSQVFNFEWYKICEIDFDKKEVTFDKNILNSKISEKSKEKRIKVLSNYFKKRSILFKNNRDNKKINRIETTDDFVDLLSQNKDFKVTVAKLNKGTTDTIKKYTLSQRQEVELEEAVDTTYMICDKDSALFENNIHEYIQKYRFQLPFFVNNYTALKETGMLFNLDAFLLPNLIRLFMENDKRMELPILFDSEEIGKGDDLIGRLDVFLDKNIKKKDEDNDKRYFIVDSYALVCNDYDLLEAYHYTQHDIKAIMYGKFIPKTKYNAFNIDAVIKEAQNIPLKYQEFSTRKIAMQDRRYVLFENSSSVEKTFLAQKNL